MKFQGFLQVVEGFCFGCALAGDINLEALRDEPISFAAKCRGKRALHDAILSRKNCALQVSL